RIDIVATEAMLSSGLRDRIVEWLPEIEVADFSGDHALPSSSRPLIAVKSAEGRFVTVRRDREHELTAIAERVKSECAAAIPKRAIVFKRPLPYLYLAAEVFKAAGLSYQTDAALPLAAEPIAGALDLVIDFASSQFTRAAAIALLRSPHLMFDGDGNPPSRE